MRNRFRCLWTGVLVILFAGLVAAQEGFIPDTVKREREGKLRDLADQILKTQDTHERVRMRDEMISLDTLMGKNGFAVPHFVKIYEASGPKEGQGGTDDVNARLQAVIGLSAIDTSESRQALIGMLNDRSDAVRVRVLKSIHDNAVIRAWEQVVPHLSDSNIEVKIWAARTLGKLQEGKEGKASQPMIGLLVKSWKELKGTDPAQADRRAELNTLIEVLGRSLEQLTGIPWKPENETALLPKAIEPYTKWWNEKHVKNLTDPRPSGRLEALQAMMSTPDMSIASPLIEFMVQERQRWMSAADADKRQHLNMLIMANDMLSQISEVDSSLSTRSTADDVAGAIKKWSDWWRDELKKMKP